jgi:hypothetical protein
VANKVGTFEIFFQKIQHFSINIYILVMKTGNPRQGKKEGILPEGLS